MESQNILLTRIENQEKSISAFIKWWWGILAALVIAWILWLISAFISLNTNVEVIKVKIDSLADNYQQQIDKLRTDVDDVSQSLNNHLQSKQ